MFVGLDCRHKNAITQEREIVPRIITDVCGGRMPKVSTWRVSQRENLKLLRLRGLIFISSPDNSNSSVVLTPAIRFHDNLILFAKGIPLGEARSVV